MSDESTGFWARGFSLFRDSLTNEERDRLAPLKEQLRKTADAEEKTQLKQAIARVRAEFRQKRKDANHSLFSNT